MNSQEHTEKPSIISSLLKETKPVLLLGAGASVTSGIPLAAEVVTKAAKWKYAKSNGKDVDDPRITRSDWFPFLESQNWFNKNDSLSNFFQNAIETFLVPQSFRKDFWVKILNPDVPVSIGYLRLVELFQLKKISHVLTVNFDNCISKAKNEINRPHHIELIKTGEDYVNISANGRYPQVIYLHGAYENYTDKNSEEEVRTLNQELVDKVIPILKDYPLIVIGYRGYEESIMRNLLIDNANKANLYKNGIYWCVIKRDNFSEELTENVKALRREIGSNFQLVEIESFDHLFDKVIWANLNEEKINIPSNRQSNQYFFDNNTLELSFDLKDAVEFNSSEIDIFLLENRVSEYCERLNIIIPSNNKEWLYMEMQNLNLLSKRPENKMYITNAGLLLFHKSPHLILKAAKTIIRFKSEFNNGWLEKNFSKEEISDNVVEKIIEGNLWNQLNYINEAISIINKPFRLKKEKSEMVMPYDPIALKEVIVNSLVHKDYESNEANVIEITEQSITVSNHGGLIKEVYSYFDIEGSDIYAELKKGIKGRKGYRNPAIADLFYGSGDMDKKGSGLADVVKLVEENGGRVMFYPDNGNTTFVVKIWVRQEAIDEITNTAIPISTFNVVSTKFYSNILELKIKSSIYRANTGYRNANDIFDDFPSIQFPAFDLMDSKIYSLTNMSNRKNTLRNIIDVPSIEVFPLDEFLQSENGIYKLVRLLNRLFSSYLKSMGLIVDMEKKKAYFPKREDKLEVSISYQAKVKKATRVVTKPKYSQDKEKIKYWEHRAFNFTFKHYLGEIGLFIEPTYTFTIDGIKNVVAPQKIGRLITKRSSRDYNIQVLNDLFFWNYIIMQGSNNSLKLKFEELNEINPDIYVSSGFVTAEMSRIELVDDEVFGDVVNDEDDEIDAEIDLLLNEPDAE